MTRRKRILLTVLGVTAVGVFAMAVWQRDALIKSAVQFNLRRNTVALPKCDRVEVFHLTGPEYGTDGQPLEIADASMRFPIRAYGPKSFAKILEAKQLTRDEAEGLAKLWRAQNFGWEFQALCHHPAYGFRFHSGMRMTFETSLCFDCSNFYVTPPVGDAYRWGFGLSESRGKLRSRLQELFPASIPKPKPPKHSGEAKKDAPKPN